MPYIGKQPTVGNFQVCDAISVVNGQAAYTMQVGSANVTPETAFHMLVSLNGVLQKPGSSFTISGSTITFASNLATGDVIDFIILLGDVLNIGAPSDDTVTAAKLNNDIISGQTALTSSAATTDEFLISDAGTLKRIDAQFFQNTPAFQATNSADQGSMGDNTYTKLVLNTELYDTDSAYDNSSNYRFTPQVAGKYYCYGQVIIVAAGGNDDAKELGLQFYKNGSAVATLVRQSLYNLGYQNSPSINLSAVIDFNGSSDYIELYAKINTVGNGTNSTAAANQSRFGAFKLTGI